MDFKNVNAQSPKPVLGTDTGLWPRLRFMKVSMKHLYPGEGGGASKVGSATVDSALPLTPLPRAGAGAERGPDLVQLLLGHVRLSLGAQGPEGALNLLTGLDVLRLTADHESHVFLQGDMAVPGGGGQVQ